MRRLILITGLLASSFSFGASWEVMGKSNNIKHYYDVDSVKPLEKHQFEFWEKHVGKTENRTIRAKVDCVNDTYTVIDTYKYHGDEMVESITGKEYKLVPPPDTVAYLTIERVCNYGTTLEIERLNLPEQKNFKSEAEYQVAKFFAFGFEDYTPTETMMNEYFDLIESVDTNGKIYKELIRVLDGIDDLKLKYIGLKTTYQ